MRSFRVPSSERIGLLARLSFQDFQAVVTTSKTSNIGYRLRILISFDLNMESQSYGAMSQELMETLRSCEASLVDSPCNKMQCEFNAVNNFSQFSHLV